MHPLLLDRARDGRGASPAPDGSRLASVVSACSVGAVEAEREREWPSFEDLTRASQAGLVVGAPCGPSSWPSRHETCHRWRPHGINHGGLPTNRGALHPYRLGTPVANLREAWTADGMQLWPASRFFSVRDRLQALPPGQPVARWRSAPSPSSWGCRRRTGRHSHHGWVPASQAASTTSRCARAPTAHTLCASWARCGSMAAGRRHGTHANSLGTQSA